MSSTRIFFFVFLVLAIVAGVFLINSIGSSIRQADRIADREAKVIQQLELIRAAESAYLAVNGQYTSCLLYTSPSPRDA